MVRACVATLAVIAEIQALRAPYEAAIPRLHRGQCDLSPTRMAMSQVFFCFTSLSRWSQGIWEKPGVLL
jgi:hypothetical protein